MEGPQGKSLVLKKNFGIATPQLPPPLAPVRAKAI